VQAISGESSNHKDILRCQPNSGCKLEIKKLLTLCGDRLVLSGEGVNPLIGRIQNLLTEQASGFAVKQNSAHSQLGRILGGRSDLAL
jgi:hypothetical protein